MTEQLIGELVTKLGMLIIFLLGFFAMIAPQRLNSLQLRQVGRHNDALSRSIYKALSKPYIATFTRILGIIVIVLILMDIFIM